MSNETKPPVPANSEGHPAAVPSVQDHERMTVDVADLPPLATPAVESEGPISDGVIAAAPTDRVSPGFATSQAAAEPPESDAHVRLADNARGADMAEVKVECDSDPSGPPSVGPPGDADIAEVANKRPILRLVAGRSEADLRVEDSANRTTEPTTAHGSGDSEAMSTVSVPGGAAQSAALLALAQANCEVFCDDNGEPLAAVEVKGRREVVRLGAREFRTWLHHLFYSKYKTMPNGTSMKDAVAVLEGAARFGSEMRKVHVRVARVSDSIYLDLANDDGEAVRISRGGWEIVQAPGIHFRRSKGMAALPRPVRGGTVDELRPLVNVPNEDAFRLLVAWEVCALRPEGPYPIVVFQGEHGAAKSSASRIARTVVDASKMPLRSMPKSERDLAVAVSSAWVLAIDNQSGFAPSVSDALCRVSTGGGVGSRQLFTDGDEFLMTFMRPVIVNGIDDLATRPDLAERALVFNLPPIPSERRVDEATLMARFRDAHPRILGALLDAVVSALANIEAVQLDAAPRMADFARWITAAEPGLGWKAGTFREAYSRHRRETDQEALERDVLGTLIPRLIPLEEGSQWSGTATQLQRDLNVLADDETKRDPTWPRMPNAMSARLRRIAPLLRTAGYVVSSWRGAAERTLTITRCASSSSSSSSLQGPGPTGGRDDRDGGDDPSGSNGGAGS